MTHSCSATPQLSRRSFLAATAAAGMTLSACGRPTTPQPSGLGEAITAAEAARPHTGRTVTAALTPGPADIDVGGGIIARTLAYNNTIPGPLIRADVGDELAVTVTNRLDHATSVHWHGIAVRHDMDGAAPGTADIEVGAQFTYRFSVPNPGTYWAHPHTGLDTDYGLYLPVIVDDPAQPGRYDAEWIVVLDDWTDGVGSNPRQLYDGLRRASTSTSPAPDMTGMPGMGDSGVPGVGGVGRGDLLGGDAGDISYPYYLINGRVPAAATTFNAKPGQRVRLRIINAGADTAFRVALAGHRITVTHTDGYPVVPSDVDAVLLGMGERYDAIITAGDGVFPLVASAEGKNAVARALLVTGAGTAPDPNFRPGELAGIVGTVGHFAAAPDVAWRSNKTDTALAATLSGTMSTYDWMIKRPPLQQHQAADDPAGLARQSDVHQHLDDGASDASARAHLPGHQRRRQSRPPQGHGHRLAPAEAAGRFQRRQPRHLDAALSQHISPGGGHDDEPELRDVMMPSSTQERISTWPKPSMGSTYGCCRGTGSTITMTRRRKRVRCDVLL
jgi:multicopper oxidase